MKKSVIFIFVLLAIIAAETWALFHHSRHPSPVEYAFDEQEYDLPPPNLQGIRPFLFETRWADEVNDALDKIQAVVESGFSDKFAKSLGNLSENRKRAAQIKQERTKGLEQLRQRAAQEAQQIKGEYLGSNRCVVNGVESACEDGIYKLENHCIACYEGQCAGTTCKEHESSAADIPSENHDNAEEAAAPQNKADETAQIQAAPVPQENTEAANDTPKPFVAEGKALVAVVIDDVGLSVPFTNQLAQIEKPVTVAFLPYGASDKSQVMKLKNAGFEVILHAPMMPYVKASLAPNTLSPEMSHDDLQEKFNVMLDRFDGTGMGGVNNHMGSKFTENTAAMSAIIEVVKQRNMFFLDSKTSSKSVVRSVCKKYDVPYIARDIFLDNERDYGKIMQQFIATERIAKKRGYAVAIGHPYPQTLKALKDWEKNLDAHGIELVPLSYLVEKTN